MEGNAEINHWKQKVKEAFDQNTNLYKQYDDLGISNTQIGIGWKVGKESVFAKFKEIFEEFDKINSSASIDKYLKKLEDTIGLLQASFPPRKSMSPSPASSPSKQVDPPATKMGVVLPQLPEPSPAKSKLNQSSESVAAAETVNATTEKKPAAEAATTPPQITPATTVIQKEANKKAPSPAAADLTAATPSTPRTEVIVEKLKEPPPAPATLKPATWQNLPAKETWCPSAFEPFLEYVSAFKYQDNLQMQKAGFDGWKILAATRRGRMHAHEATHREDAFAVEIGNRFIVASVSDGAGSYEFSRIGSETTCREVNRRIREFLEANLTRLETLDEDQLKNEVGTAISQSVYETCKFLHELAASAKCLPKDLRCTLLIGLLFKTAKAMILLTSHVGDGFLAGLDRQGKAARYGTSDSGEFSGEVNCFIPDHDAPAKASNIKPINPQETEALILCTDGIEDPFYPTEKRAVQIFSQLYNGVEKKLDDFKSQKNHAAVIGSSTASELLDEWLSFEKQGENDDRTILILYREPTTIDRSKIT